MGVCERGKERKIYHVNKRCSNAWIFSFFLVRFPLKLYFNLSIPSEVFFRAISCTAAFAGMYFATGHLANNMIRRKREQKRTEKV